MSEAMLVSVLAAGSCHTACRGTLSESASDLASARAKERGAYQFQWLIHHPSSINGSIKKEQCAVGSLQAPVPASCRCLLLGPRGLLLQNDFSELYRASSLSAYFNRANAVEVFKHSPKKG